MVIRDFPKLLNGVFRTHNHKFICKVTLSINNNNNFVCVIQFIKRSFMEIPCSLFHCCCDNAATIKMHRKNEFT